MKISRVIIFQLMRGGFLLLENQHLIITEPILIIDLRTLDRRGQTALLSAGADLEVSDQDGLT